MDLVAADLVDLDGVRESEREGLDLEKDREELALGREMPRPLLDVPRDTDREGDPLDIERDGELREVEREGLERRIERDGADLDGDDRLKLREPEERPADERPAEERPADDLPPEDLPPEDLPPRICAARSAAIIEEMPRMRKKTRLRREA